MTEETTVVCPGCGGDADGELRTEVFEGGKPTNTNTRGAVAPNYRTREVDICGVDCDECGLRAAYDEDQVEIVEDN